MLLTHYGQAVGQMDRFDDVRLSDEEELAEGMLSQISTPAMSVLVLQRTLGRLTSVDS